MLKASRLLKDMETMLETIRDEFLDLSSSESSLVDDGMALIEAELEAIEASLGTEIQIGSTADAICVRSVFDLLDAAKAIPQFVADGRSIAPHLAGLKSAHLSRMTKSLETFLLDAAKSGDADLTRELLEGGAKVNFQDPVSGATALHFAAAIEAFRVVEVLLEAKGVDHLVKDEEGQFASARAWEVAENSDLGTMLMEREIKQAQSQGLDYRDLLTGRARER